MAKKKNSPQNTAEDTPTVALPVEPSTEEPADRSTVLPETGDVSDVAYETPTAMTPTRLPEAPFSGVRIGLLVWAGIVAITGGFMIISAFFNGISAEVLFPVLVAAFGVLLIMGAGISAIRARN